MDSPRIYTYKVTFEEIPHWYWGVHKENKFGEVYWGSPKTNKRVWNLYTPRLQILELFPFTEEGWKEANHVEDRLILPDLNNPLCLNESCGARVSLKVLSDNAAKIPREVLADNGRKTGLKNLKAAQAALTPEILKANAINLLPYCSANGRNFPPDIRSANGTKSGRKNGAINGRKNSKRVLLTKIETEETFEFPSASEAARELGLGVAQLCKVARGDKKQHKGYAAVYL